MPEKRTVSKSRGAKDALPVTYKGLWAVLEAVIELCVQLKIRRERVGVGEGRPRGYVPPVFPRAVARFAPPEKPECRREFQYELNHLHATFALDALLTALLRLPPRPPVVGKTIYISECLDYGPLVLTIPAGMADEQFRHELALAKKTVESVTSDEFKDLLFFQLLVYKGFGVQEAPSLDLDALLKSARLQRTPKITR